jgi:hypothetical protein
MPVNNNRKMFWHLSGKLFAVGLHSKKSRCSFIRGVHDYKKA